MQFQEPGKNYAEIDPKVPMAAVTPAVEGVDQNGVVLGKWKAGMLQFYGDCVPNGLMVFVCPGVSVAQICARLGFVNYFAVLTAFAILYILAIVALATDNDVVVTLIVIGSLLMGLFVARLRSRVRYLFSLPGSLVEDVLYACFLGPCAIAQMATHVESYQVGDCGIAPRATLPGYTFA